MPAPLVLTGNANMLDAEEYFHLALHASATGDPHACMTYLQEVLRQEPRHARAMYLLAAVHAELGLVERAIGGIEAALGLDPGLDTARLQLSLLLLFERNQRAEARMHLAHLAGSRDDTLRLYAEALIAAADDDSALAAHLLEVAIAQSKRNTAFTALMRRLVEWLKSSEEIVDPHPALSPKGEGKRTNSGK